MNKIFLISILFFMATLTGCGIPPFDEPSEESDDCVSVSGQNNTVYYSNGINLLNNNTKHEANENE